MLQFDFLYFDNFRLTSGLMGTLNPLFMGAIWGVGDGVLNTQLSALLGLLFKNSKVITSHYSNVPSKYLTFTFMTNIL